MHIHFQLFAASDMYTLCVMSCTKSKWWWKELVENSIAGDYFDPVRIMFWALEKP
jgi:hypothetical protein